MVIMRDCCTRYLVLGQMGISGILALATLCNIEKKPFGHKMCKELCNNTGCLPDYSFTHLFCNATFFKLTRKSKKYVNCRFPDQITKETLSPNVVRHTGNGESDAVTSKNPLIKPGLLLVPSDKRNKYTFRELDLSSSRLLKTTEYPKLTAKGAISLTYTPTFEILFVSTKHPYQIFAYDVNDAKIVFRKNNFKSFGMAVDDKTELLFFTMDRPTQGVCVMTVSGHGFKILQKVHYVAWDISLDTKRELIYSCGNNYIFSLSYDGTDYQKLMKGPGTHALIFDPVTNSLYFNKVFDIYRFSFQTKTEQKLGRMKKLPVHIVLYNNTAYVTKQFKSSLSILYLKSSKVRELNIGEGDMLQMCLIPE